MPLINNIKIFGERNSGTTFLQNLLNSNITNVNIYSGAHNGGTGWKHGYPKLDFFEKEETLFIFLIRDLEPWLISMFKNPYHYKAPKTIENFINNPMIIYESDKTHDIHTNPEENKLIIDLRIAKIKSYLEFFELVDNAFIINLESIQKDQGKNLLDILNQTFDIDLHPDFNSIDKHTKCNQPVMNRNYSIQVPNLDQKINKPIENFVQHLKSFDFLKVSTINQIHSSFDELLNDFSVVEL